MNNLTTNLSVLITDDMQQNRFFIAQIILSVANNAQISEAENGELAVAAVAAKIEETGTSFDLIIMDFKMPVMNGADATAAIRELEQTIQQPSKSIIITWSSAKNSPYRHADDWMPKMVDREEVKRVLRLHGLIV